MPNLSPPRHIPTLPSCDLREGPTTAQRNLTNRRFALRWTRSHELGAPPTGAHPNEQSNTLAAHAVQTEGRVTFPLRQYLGSALSAEPQARGTIPRSHASMRRASLGIQLVSACLRSRLRQAWRPRARLR